MRFTISQSVLLEHLKIVSRAVSNQLALPVLGNILIRAEGKKVYFSATNLEMAISTATEAHIKNEGSITIPAKVLTAYVSLLSDEEIEMSVADGLALLIETAQSKTKIKGLSADEFPNIPTIEGGAPFAVSGKDLAAAVEQVAFAAQTNATRPVLGGVSFELENSELRLVATDSYRLSLRTIGLEKSAKKATCVVPVRALVEMQRLLQSEDCEASVWLSDNQILFRVDGHELTSRLIDGQFPNYQEIIPKEHATTVLLDRESLQMSVRRLSIFAKEDNQQIRLEVGGDGRVVLSTNNTQVGEDHNELLGQVTGPSTAVTLNADYVLAALQALHGESKVRFNFGEKVGPVVVTAEKKGPFLHLIMPLKR